jgi:C4-dicarboxylate transporter DctQ subunit
VKTRLTKLGVAWDRFLDASLVVSAAAVVTATLLTLSDIVSRQFFGAAQGWAIEISEYSLVYIAFFGAAWLLREEGHIKVEVVVEVLKSRHQALLGIATSFVGVVVTGLLAYFATTTTINEYLAGTYMYESPLKPPLYALLIPIPVGATALCIQFMRRTYGYYCKWETEKADMPAGNGQE